MKCCKKPKGKESYNIPKIESKKNDFTDFELDVLELVNYYRRIKGLQMLKFSMKLANIAFVHTNYMVEKGIPSHDNFPIRNVQAIKNCGATWLGENVGYGYGTPKGFFDSWINSEGHRKIIESKKASEFAISIIQNKKLKNFATLLFID